MNTKSAIGSETEIKEQFDKLTDSDLSNETTIRWLLTIPTSHEGLLANVVDILAKAVQLQIDFDLTKECLNFLKRNIAKQQRTVDVTKKFIAIAILAQASDNEDVVQLSDEILIELRPQVYKEDATLTAVVECLKDDILPQMKDLADAKNFSNALALWRAIVKFTALEKLPTAVTNRILLVATMAFKEPVAEVHLNAFRSWAVLIRHLPHAMLKKSAYIKLLLNPLNRIYRDTDSMIASQKFAAWWQLILSLREDVNTHFDDVVSNLLQKVFNLPSAKARQVNPACATPTKEVIPEAYTILALLLYNGEETELMKQLALENFSINEVFINGASFVKHNSLIEEVLNICLNNIVENVTPPPQFYAYLLCKILFSRINSLHNAEHHGLVRLFLVSIYKLLQHNLFDVGQMLSIYGDLANGIPQKVMVSSQFNLRQGSFSMHECPVISLTAFFIENVSNMCGESEHQTYNTLLKVLLERGTACMNILQFTGHIMASLGRTNNCLNMNSWIEVANLLINHIKHTHEVNQGSSLEHDFTAVIDTLNYPFREEQTLRSDVVLKWSELFTVFAVDATRVKEIAPNQHIEELCNHLLRQLSKTKFDLHRLRLTSEILETVTKQCTLTGLSTAKKSSLGNLNSIIECISLLATEGFEFIAVDDKTNCVFFAQIIDLCGHFIKGIENDDLCYAVSSRFNAVLTLFLDLTVKEVASINEGNRFLASLSRLIEIVVKKAESSDSKLSVIVDLLAEKYSNHFYVGIKKYLTNNSTKKTTQANDENTQNKKEDEKQQDEIAKNETEEAKIENTEEEEEETKQTPAKGRRRSRKAVNENETDNEVPVAKSPRRVSTTKVTCQATRRSTRRSTSKYAQVNAVEETSEPSEDASTVADVEKPQEKEVPKRTGKRISKPAANETHVEEITEVIPEAAEEENVSKAAVEMNSPLDNAKELEKEEINCVVKQIESKNPKNEENQIDNQVVGEQEDKSPIEKPTVEDENLDKNLEKQEQTVEQPQNSKLKADAINNCAESAEQQMVEENKTSCDNNNQNSAEPTPLTPDDNSENDEPTIKRIKTANGDAKPNNLTKNQEHEEEQEIASPLRPNGARKRKLGQVVQSPIATKLQQRNFILNSPSSRSRRMLEAAQAKTLDARQSMAGCTPRHNAVFHVDSPMPCITSEISGKTSLVFSTPPATTRGGILKRATCVTLRKSVSFSAANEICPFVEENNVLDSLQQPLSTQQTGLHSSPIAEEEMETGEKIEVENEKNLTNEIASLKSDDSEMKTDEDTAIANGDERPPSQELVEHDVKSSQTVVETVDVVDVMSTALGQRREQMLEYISSNEFLKNMTSEERAPFIAKLLNNIVFYIQ